MRIYQHLSKPHRRNSRWTFGVTALLVLACGDPSAPIVLPIIEPAPVPGPQFAFVELSGGSAQIVVVDANGAETLLSPPVAWDQDPAWSPDGSRIAFRSGQDGKSDIYIMNATGGNRVRLTTDESANSRPAWSHDGGRIAFVSRRDGNSEIYVMNADGSHQTRLTFRENFNDTDPAWSPDGTRIAFATSGGILVITADGAETVQLTSGYTDDAPAWSPDGSRIAFSSETQGTRLIFVMNADGSGRAEYLPYGRATDPSWSPDGTRIAFVTQPICDYQDYYSDCGTYILIGQPGTPVYSLPTPDNSVPTDPAWRP